MIFSGSSKFYLGLQFRGSQKNMKTNKIIYLCFLPINQYLEKNHYIGELIKTGISVEYWDLSNIFFPGVKFLSIERQYAYKIHNYSELEGRVLSLDIKRCVFIISITFYAPVIRLNRIMTKYNCYIITFARLGVPVFSLKESLIKKIIISYYSGKTIYNLTQQFLYIIAKIYTKLGLIKNYDLVFVAGSVEAALHNKVSKIIYFNQVDYDSYLGVKDNQDRLIAHRYCVFLDDNLVYDTDYKAFGLKTVEPELYYKSLRFFFDQIERRFNLKVIIAAHPKADYQGNEFGNRLIIKGKTTELAKDCDFVLAHYSVSISFSVLFKKRILFMYTNEMKKMFYFTNIRHYSQVLGASIYNIDSFLHECARDEIKLENIDSLKYEDYKYEYLTSRLSENELSRDIFLKTMQCIAFMGYGEWAKVWR